MAIVFKKDSEKKASAFQFYLEEEGFYKVVMTAKDDKVDEGGKDGKGKRKGWKLHPITLQFENGKKKFVNIYYENKEGDLDPNGYNFLMALRDVLVAWLKNNDESGLAKKVLEEADSNKILAYLIKHKVPFYVETQNSIYNGEDQTNVSTFQDPILLLKDAEEVAEKKNKKVVELKSTTSKKTSKKAVEEDEEDEDYEDDDDDL